MIRGTAMISVAIVGAGPAGSYCAYELAKKGIFPLIFDFAHPREKPCGGLLPSNAQELFPFLKTIPISHSERSAMIVITPSGRRIVIGLRKGKFMGFSRLEFDGYLLDMAVNQGAELVEEKVIGIENNRDHWMVRTEKHSFAVKTLVGADGVNSMVRRNIIGSLDKKDIGVCFGCFVKGLENKEITLKFLPAKKGYIWVIPRGDDTSIGIGSSEIRYSHELKNELSKFIHNFCPQTEKISEWAALIPNVKDTKTLRAQIAGSNWIIIGDAAGHVDPITGSGIVYALLDGELAAEEIAEGNPEMFNNLWIETYGQQLLLAAKLRSWIYKRPLLELYCMYLKVQSLTPIGIGTT